MRQTTQLLRMLVLLALVAPACIAGSTPSRAAEQPLVRAVGSVTLVVGDLHRSVAFYTAVLDVMKIDESEVSGTPYEQLEGIFGLRIRSARLALGDEQIELQEYLVPKQRLPDWNRSAAGIRAFYFRDPDGHDLEILQFPPGKGAPKRHAPTSRMFLGIDHTAIVVRDTETSLRFYRDALIASPEKARTTDRSKST